MPQEELDDATAATDHSASSVLRPGSSTPAMSSLATFLSGLIAATLLDEFELGVYAVFFTAFNFGQVIANNLVYVPAEVVAVAWPAAETDAGTGAEHPSRNVAFAGGAAAAAGIGALVAAQVATAPLVAPLAITTVLTTFFGRPRITSDGCSTSPSAPGQRQRFRHFTLALTATSMRIDDLLDVDAAWIPFGRFSPSELRLDSPRTGPAASAEPGGLSAQRPKGSASAA